MFKRGSEFIKEIPEFATFTVWCLTTTILLASAFIYFSCKSLLEKPTTTPKKEPMKTKVLYSTNDLSQNNIRTYLIEIPEHTMKKLILALQPTSDHPYPTKNQEIPLEDMIESFIALRALKNQIAPQKPNTEA